MMKKDNPAPRIVVVDMKVDTGDVGTEIQTNIKGVGISSAPVFSTSFTTQSESLTSIVFPNSIDVSTSDIHDKIDSDGTSSKGGSPPASTVNYKRTILPSGKVYRKQMKIDPNITVKEEPMELLLDSSEAEVTGTNMGIEVTNTDFMDVFDKAVGDVSTMFKKLNDDPLNYVECTVCFKKIKESSMKQHFRTHAGLRPYPCDVCGTCFTRKSDVYRHKRVVHKKVKPYICKMCDKTFPHRNLLLVHLQNHSNHVNYECSTCGFKFGKKEYYDSHISLIHPTNSAPKTSVNRSDVVEEQLRELEEEDEMLHESISRLNSRISKSRIEAASTDGEQEEDDLLSESSGCDDGEETVTTIEPTRIKEGEIQSHTADKPEAIQPKDIGDEELVHKILDAAVKQSTNALHGLAAAAAAQR